MPTCRECGHMQATVEMRRSPKEGWLCKDKQGCKRRKVPTTTTEEDTNVRQGSRRQRQ